MSNFQKSSLTVDGNSVHLSMPFSKIDESRRLVSGYATLDNIDSQGDVVTAEASAKAFSRARGNLREMHAPIAVGKIIDFREDEFYDTKNKTFYRGIFVTARVSEGAQDTWLKVLDGTLTGFSIGGEINEATNEFVKEANKTVRFIKDYDLVELSLVDNPANQLANIFSIEKSATGSVTVKGMVAETEIENVFICSSDETVVVKDSDSHDCPMCGINMENAGWFEAGPNRAEKVGNIVSKFLSQSDVEAAPENADSEGGVEMGTENEELEKNNDAQVEQAGSPEEVDKPVENEVEAVEEEESDAPEEVEDESTEISKKIDELHEAVKESLEKSQVETSEQVAALEKKIDEVNESFVKKASELESKLGEFGEKLETAKSRLASFEESLEKMNSSEAIKKSADLEDEPAETVQKSKTTWNGAFSVNNLL